MQHRKALIELRKPTINGGAEQGGKLAWRKREAGSWKREEGRGKRGEGVPS
jgi:hypothetical protein